MRVEPQLKINRFEQLEVGDLFVADFEGGCCFALKVIDPERDGDTLILPLGPSFPRELSPGQFVVSPERTCISFGKDYSVRLPADVNGWSIEDEPDFAQLALVVTQGNIYIRANSNPRKGIFHRCFVGLHDGRVLYGGVSQIRAYATRWEIVVADRAFPGLTALRVPTDT
jgi:hypothetical protein